MILSDFDTLRSHPEIRFKQEIIDGITVEIVTYMIGNDELWKIPLALEARGITFNAETGECICRPFEKFFNLIGETNYSQTLNLNTDIIECFEKRDGSMITPVLINNKIFWKTKKTFSSDVSILASQLVTPEIEAFSKKCLESDCTPIFEFTHPESKIVIDYPTHDNFTLLAIRSIKTGQYIPYKFIKDIAESYGNIAVIKQYEKSWDEICQDIETLDNFEGYVLILKNNVRVKVKTSWYKRNHRIMTDLRERDVVEMVLDDTVDDLKSLLISENKDITPVLKIESEINNSVIELIKQVMDIVKESKTLTAKEMALRYNGHEYFSLIMREFRGNNVDWKGFWKQRNLKNFKLVSIYNSNF
jgi:RNA ligase